MQQGYVDDWFRPDQLSSALLDQIAFGRPSLGAADFPGPSYTGTQPGHTKIL